MTTWFVSFLLIGTPVVMVSLASAAPAPVPTPLPVAPSAIAPPCRCWLETYRASQYEYHPPNAPNAPTVVAVPSVPAPASSPDWFSGVPGWQALNPPYANVPPGVLVPRCSVIWVAPPVHWSVP